MDPVGRGATTTVHFMASICIAGLHSPLTVFWENNNLYTLQLVLCELRTKVCIQIQCCAQNGRSGG